MSKTVPGFVLKLLNELVLGNKKWKVQKFNNESMNPFVWIINKIQSNDDFVLRSPNGEYVYLTIDEMKNKFHVFYMGVASVELFKTFEINQDMTLDVVKKSIEEAAFVANKVAQNYKNLFFEQELKAA